MEQPNIGKIHVAAGLEQLRAKRYEQALECFRIIRKQSFQYSKLDEYEALALEGCLGSLLDFQHPHLLSTEPSVLEALGRLYLAKGQTTIACLVFEFAQTKSSCTVSLHQAYAIALCKEERFADAVKQLNIAISNEPDNGELWLEKAKVLFLSGLPTEASVTIERCIKKNPEQSKLWPAYIWFLINAQRYAEAESELLPERFESKQYVLLKGRICWECGRHQEALDLLHFDGADSVTIALLMACIPSMHIEAEKQILDLLHQEKTQQNHQALIAYLLFSQYQAEKFTEAYECCKVLLDFSNQTRWFAFALFVQPLLLNRLGQTQRAKDTLEDASVWLPLCDKMQSDERMMLSALIEDKLHQSQQRNLLLKCLKSSVTAQRSVTLIESAIRGKSMAAGFGMIADLVLPLWRDEKWPIN